MLRDYEYLGRVWTQFEAWLSMQKSTAPRLLSTLEAERRCAILVRPRSTSGAPSFSFSGFLTYSFIFSIFCGGAFCAASIEPFFRVLLRVSMFLRRSSSLG